MKQSESKMYSVNSDFYLFGRDFILAKKPFGPKKVYYVYMRRDKINMNYKINVLQVGAAQRYDHT